MKRKNTPGSMNREASLPQAGQGDSEPVEDQSFLDRFKDLWRYFSEEDSRFVRVVIASVLSGVSSAGVVLTIAMVAKRSTDGFEFGYLAVFIILVIVRSLTKRYIDMRTARIAHTGVAKIRLSIAKKMRRIGLLEFESIQSEHIRTTLAENCELLTDGCRAVVRTLPSIVMVSVSMLFIVNYSQIALVVSVVSISISFWALLEIGGEATRDTRRLLRSQERFFEIFEHFLQGFKEMKIHSPRSDELHNDHLIPVTHEYRDLKAREEIHFGRISLWSTQLIFLVMGVTIFILPQYLSMPPAEILGIVLVLMFVCNHVQRHLPAVLTISRGSVALDVLRQLESRLSDAMEPSRESGGGHPPARNQFSSLTLEGIRFAYPPRTDNEESFSIGPADLNIQRGELVFIRGGNGSGKTTLLKVMAGLYRPSHGRILIDGEVIGDACQADYRNRISVVFADFHLFDRLYGMPVNPEQAAQMLEKMGLESVTAFEDGAFTRLNLSTGQRKRLAFTTAWLEDRPICVFDEVGADQDPEFRHRLYNEYLPELCSQGKAVIAITHDEKYFDHCDRLLAMHQGVLTKEV